MKVLLDQSCPIGVSRLLTGRDVTTAYRQGWDTLENGDLLAAAEGAGFEVMVTCDQNIKHQNRLAGRKIALVVLTTNAWPVIRENAAMVV